MNYFVTLASILFLYELVVYVVCCEKNKRCSGCGAGTWFCIFSKGRTFLSGIPGRGRSFGYFNRIAISLFECIK